MTIDEVRDVLYNNGQFDCGTDDDLKLYVLDKLEDFGFKIGFNKASSYMWRYIYYDIDLGEVHMSRVNDMGKSPTIPADCVLDCDTSIEQNNVCDWVDFFFCCT